MNDLIIKVKDRKVDKRMEPDEIHPKILKYSSNVSFINAISKLFDK